MSFYTRSRQLIILPLIALSVLHAQTDRANSTIILDEMGEKNLNIKTAEAEFRSFEQTSFAIGHIAEIPANHAVLSSRIAGRITAIRAFEGDYVEKGDIIVEVESRQPGNPPPTIPLLAPQSGMVTETHVRIGEPVEPENELLDISDTSSVWAIARLPEILAGDIAPGAKARITVPASGKPAITATLLRFATFANEETGTLDAIFLLDNQDSTLRPGMRAEFAIVQSERKDVLSIPRTAVQGSPTSRIVFAEDFDLPHAYVRLPVQLGEQNDSFVEVISGVFPGDRVVTEGSYLLSFAGNSNGISLKEALDAAHGHEHNDDGSEMTSDQEENGRPDDHHHSEKSSSFTTVLTALCVLLTVALLVALQQIFHLRRRA